MNEQLALIARSVFEAYARNSGNDPDSHYDRKAAEEWMAEALEEVGLGNVLHELDGVVRVEPLHDVSAEDCIAAGFVSYLSEHCAVVDLQNQYQAMWEARYGAASWNANPYVLRVRAP